MRKVTLLEFLWYCVLLYFIIVTFITPHMCFAQQPQSTFNYITPAVFSAPVYSPGVNVSKGAVAYHTITWYVTGGGTLSSCTVGVDSSTNGNTWNNSDVVSQQTCTSNGQLANNNDVVSFVRINVGAWDCTGTCVLQVVYTGYTNSQGGGGGGNFTYTGDGAGNIIQAKGATTGGDSGSNVITPVAIAPAGLSITAPYNRSTVWAANQTYHCASSVTVFDSTNVELCSLTSNCTSGATAPSWNVTVGGTTTDNTCTWTNEGPNYPTLVAATIEGGLQVGGDYSNSSNEDVVIPTVAGGGVVAGALIFDNNGQPGNSDGNGGINNIDLGLGNYSIAGATGLGSFTGIYNLPTGDGITAAGAFSAASGQITGLTNGSFNAANGGFQVDTAGNTALANLTASTVALAEQGMPSGVLGKDVIYGDSTTHQCYLSLNSGTFYPIATTNTSSPPNFATTVSITGTTLATIGCTSTATTTVTGVTTTMVAVISAVGTDAGSTFIPKAWVSAANTVSYCLFGIGTFSTTSYAIRVIQ